MKISEYPSDLFSKGETDQGRAVHSRSHMPLSHLLCQREGSSAPAQLLHSDERSVLGRLLVR